MSEQVSNNAVTSIATTGVFHHPGEPLSSTGGSLGRAYREIAPVLGMPSAVELAEGTRLGERYEIVRKLGQGGMGVVYEARNTNVEHIRYAIKTLIPGRSHVDSAHFLQEAKRASRVRSPHVVQIFDFGTEPSSGLTYMVMDYIGEDVETYIRRHGGSLPPAVAIELSVQVCEALTAAHGQKLVHRDIKPLNCLLRAESERETIVVTDFGIARDILGTLQRREDGSSEAWTAVGTPGYIAPEVWLREAGADYRVDIYSVGAMLFRMLVGNPPPLAPTSEELAKAGLPPMLLPILTCALARSPKDRYASAKAFQNALRAAASQIDVAIPEAPPAPRRLPWLAWTAVMLAAVTVVLYAVLFVQPVEATDTSASTVSAIPKIELEPHHETSPPLTPPPAQLLEKSPAQPVQPSTEQSPVQQSPVHPPLVQMSDPVQGVEPTPAEPSSGIVPDSAKQRHIPEFADRKAHFLTALQARCKQLGPCKNFLKLKQSGPYKNDTLEVILYFKFSPRKAYPSLESRDLRLDLGEESQYRACMEKRMRSVKEFVPTRDGGELTCPAAL